MLRTARDRQTEQRPFVSRLETMTVSWLDDFEGTYQAHYRDVYRYVLALTRSTLDAEEITADVFERAFRSWRSVPSRALPWLLLTARRIATDRWRRVRVFMRSSNALRRPATPDSPFVDTEFRLWFDAISKLLTSRQREVLLLRYQRDLSDREIGLIMHLSESGVRSLVARALSVLRSSPELL